LLSTCNSSKSAFTLFHIANYFGLTPTEDSYAFLSNDVNLNNFLDDASCFTLSAVPHESQSRMCMTLDTKVVYHITLFWHLKVLTSMHILNICTRLNIKFDWWTVQGLTERLKFLCWVVYNSVRSGEVFKAVST
jgi:hypothetical protein